MNEYVIQPQSGIRIEVNKGQQIKIIDVDGGQVADFFAEMKETHEEYVSPSVTIDCNESLKIKAGTVIYSNLYKPMFRVEHDDVGAHDLLFPACSKNMYDFFYQNGPEHPNCLDNINHALETKRTIIQPINFFMNTVIGSDGKIEIKRTLSKAGDKIVLAALADCALGISACDAR